MPYRKEIFTAPGYVEIKKYFCWRLGGKKNRAPNWRRTPEDVAAVNGKRAEEKLRRTILTNFKRDDLYVTLTYREEPDYETAKKEIRNFLRRLKSAYKKKGLELRYIYTTEYRGKRLHHHLIINDGVTRAECESLWGNGLINRYGFQRFDGEPEDAKNLAKYLIKEAKRNVREGKQKTRWVGSKNLIQPEVHYRTIHAARWKETPPTPEGMELVSVENYVGGDGFPVQLAAFRERRSEWKKQNGGCWKWPAERKQRRSGSSRMRSSGPSSDGTAKVSKTRQR